MWPLAAAPLLLVAAAATTETDRRLGAIVGGALTDAAAMPLHWIYDTTKIQSLVSGGQQPAFFSPPSCPFYKYPEGENTPYGQQNRVYLGVLAAKPPHSSSDIEPAAFQDAYYAYYGPEGAPCHTRQGMLPTQKHGCYWDASTKGFVDNYETGRRYPQVGANDTQGNALVHMVSFVAALAGEKVMLDAVAKVIRVTQDTDKAVAFGLAGARVLERVILGDAPLAAVRAAVAALREPSREHPLDEDAELANGLERVLGELGKANFDVVTSCDLGRATRCQSCDYPYGLWSGSHLVAQLSDVAGTAAAFINGTAQTIMAGGDSASRGTYVGAVLGAAVGEATLPSEWKAKYLHYKEIIGNARKLFALPPTALV